MQGLLSVSFGTVDEGAYARSIGAIEEALSTAFPERQLYSAWTSAFVAARVQAETGAHHDTLAEAFARLSADGVDDLLISTTCLTQGRAMDKVDAAAAAWVNEGSARTAHLTSPLLANEADRRMVAQTVCSAFADVAETEVVLLMGHGVAGSHNEMYRQMQDALTAVGVPRVFLALVEGSPGFDEALARVEKLRPTCVHLAPFMMVAGGHVHVSLVGDAPDSWKSQLEARGMKTHAVLRGLGEYAEIRNLVVRHARSVCSSGR